MSYLVPLIRALGAIVILIAGYISIAALGLYSLEMQGNWIRWLIPLAQLIILIALLVSIPKVLYPSNCNIHRSNYY